MKFPRNLRYTDSVSMKSYLAQIALAFLFFLLCIGAFNWWADPYGIWGPVEFERLNRNQQAHFLRLSKPLQIARIKPTAAIIGSSRSGTIGTQSPVWAEDTAYNMSVQGMSVYEMKRFIEHTIAQGELKKLLIAIEFDTFIPAWPRARIGPVENRLSHPGEQGLSWLQAIQQVGDLRDTLLTSSTLARSVQAQFGKAPPGRAMQADGSWAISTRSIGKKGFIHSGKLLVERTKSRNWGVDANLEILAEILALCHRYKVDTRLYLSPEHLFITDFRRHIGYGEQRDDFLRQVVAINEEVAASTGSKPFPLWAFNHMPGIVDDPLVEGKEEPQWFRDGFHFYGNLGEMIMEQVWGSSGAVGVRLDSETINPYLDKVEMMRARFVQDHERLVLAYRGEILGGAGGAVNR